MQKNHKKATVMDFMSYNLLNTLSQQEKQRQRKQEGARSNSRADVDRVSLVASARAETTTEFVNEIATTSVAGGPAALARGWGRLN